MELGSQKGCSSFGEHPWVVSFPAEACYGAMLRGLKRLAKSPKIGEGTGAAPPTAYSSAWLTDPVVQTDHLSCSYACEFRVRVGLAGSVLDHHASSSSAVVAAVRLSVVQAWSFSWQISEVAQVLEWLLILVPLTPERVFASPSWLLLL